MPSKLWLVWRCSSLMAVLSHYDQFPVIALGCCWVPENFPCWVLFLAGLLLEVLWQQWELARLKVCVLGIGMAFKEAGHQPREGFCSGLEHSVAQLLLTESLQFSSANFPLGAFVVWALTSMWFSC
jgi:hypothetical protein